MYRVLKKNWDESKYLILSVIFITSILLLTVVYKSDEKIIKKTGQVCIQVRDVQGVGDNPFDFEYVKSKIVERLEPKYKNRFKVVLVPNITNICYGREVGYKVEELVLPQNIEKISATKIRKEMRQKGKIK